MSVSHLKITGIVGLALVCLAASAARPVEEDIAPGAEEDGTIPVVDIPDETNIASGEPFKRWMKSHGWQSEFGSPEYFYVSEGKLHMVSKPGPVYNDRFSLAIFNREKLVEGMENKVLLRVVGGRNFRIDPREYPYIRFRMAPVQLPGEGADLLDPSRNDSAFYLLVGFDTERHEFEGRAMPETVAYVWANREWDEPVGSDSDYSEFLRYIAVGHGNDAPGAPREFARNVARDYRRLFPDSRGEVPDVIQVGLMIDSNTVGGTAKSIVHHVRFETKKVYESEFSRDGGEEGR